MSFINAFFLYQKIILKTSFVAIARVPQFFNFMDGEFTQTISILSYRHYRTTFTSKILCWNPPTGFISKLAFMMFYINHLKK